MAANPLSDRAPSDLSIVRVAASRGCLASANPRWFAGSGSQPPVVAALPIATLEPAPGTSCAIVLTRSMRAARRWIRRQRRGTERAGLVAFSSAQRPKPHAIDIRVNIDPVHWFLSPAKDSRSSLYLKDAATEFQMQGLELDWTIVTWDADLRWSGDDWSYHGFRGTKWTDVKKPKRRRYLKNAYRVLLTRARQPQCKPPHLSQEIKNAARLRSSSHTDGRETPRTDCA
jgi:hypothetical protein